MHEIKRVKHILDFRILRNRTLRSIILDVYLTLFRWRKRQHDKHFGKLNPSLKFYVIRSKETDEGLLSLYMGRLREIYSCMINGYIPIIDFENYRTSYSVKFPVNGTRNAWEYYFEQPSQHTLEEVYQSQNVRLSGWQYSLPSIIRNLKSCPPPPQLIQITQDAIRKTMQIAPVKKYIYDIAEEKIRSHNITEMIGVLVRGTDYVSLKPIGHPIPPTAEQASSKLDEFLSRYGQRKIFLATEDEKIYNFFVNKYGELIYTTDDRKNLVKNYSGRDYLTSELDSQDRYKFGLDYLVKMICLSRCKCLIASMTNGAQFVRLLNNNNYTEEYIFNLGHY